MNDHLHVGSHSHGQIQVQQLFEVNNKWTVLTIQPNGLTTVGKVGLLVGPEWQLREHPQTAGELDRFEVSAKHGEGESHSMTSDQAMKQYVQKLSSFENHEIFSYPEICFLVPNAKKCQA